MGLGSLCLINWLPTDALASRTTIIVPAFAEEMNNSRRMATLMAQRIASKGGVAIQFDPWGTGDSDGDFGQASWDIWLGNLVEVVRWAKSRFEDPPVSLIGIRIGAFIALEFATLEDIELRCDSIALWQPVIRGDTFLTQFLRLRLASDMLGAAKVAGGVSELRSELASGRTIEVAGYELSSEMANKIDSLRLDGLVGATHPPIAWFEVSQSGASAPVVQKTFGQWKERGVPVSHALVEGPPFWGIQELAIVPELLSATERFFGMTK